MENVFVKIEELKEEFKQADKETEEFVIEAIKMARKYYDKTTKRLYTRGLVMGAVGAVAIQSIVTILVLIK